MEGNYNCIGDATHTAANGFIGGGQCNGVFRDLAAVVGGCQNSAHSCMSFIGGGGVNNIFIKSDCSFLGGGSLNGIGDSSVSPVNFATESFLGGGSMNCIDAVGANTKFGVIGGGQSNTVCAGTNHSSIFSGKGNTVSGSCSAILGGFNNNDNGLANVGIFGNNINNPLNMAANTFHVNSLIMQNIPAVNAVTYAPLVSGQLYTIIAAPGFTARPVYIK